MTKEKLLDEAFCDYTHKGFDYKLHKHKGVVGLYSQSLDGVFVGYEVVIARYVKERKVFNKVYPAHYHLPTDINWGRYGWTFKSSQRAEDKFKELT